jgi:hypothetical protein
MSIYQKQRQRFKLSFRIILFGSAMFALAFVLFFLYGNFFNAEKVLAGPGIHGEKTVNTSNVILNEFTALISDAIAGSTSITVASSLLNTNNRFSQPLAPGELVLIIQMQGATLNTESTTSSTWGSVTGLNNAGKFEFNEVASVSNSTTINLLNALSNSYTAAGNVQVVRVPRYSSFTINAGASVTTDSWNGSTGGVLAVEVNGNTTINGSINVSKTGFRGGSVDNGSVNPSTSVTVFASTDSLRGGEKGESIGGNQAMYDMLGGRYGRGAPANGGGGGNSNNAGGGGGSNAGMVASWNGQGNPDTISVAGWKTAWAIESPNFHKNISAGGGRGGYSWSKRSKDPLTFAPGNTAWMGNNRLNVGGYGGRALDNSDNRIFLGGGGGAGDANDSVGTAGGNGGGIVFLLTGLNCTGNGEIYADGGCASNVTPVSGSDAAGGGGGGGSVYIFSPNGNVSSLTITAKGGNGGNQNNNDTEAEGPGGGGSGGFITISNPVSLSTSVSGGAGGKSSSSGVTSFTPNGATSGADGIILSNPMSPYSGGTTLPINLKCFSATQKENVIKLSWTTNSEINNDQFVIERSSDGTNYYRLGRIMGKGNSTIEQSYQFIDDAPFNGDNFYVLEQIDYDGHLQAFEPVHINFIPGKQPENKTEAGPNPFKSWIKLSYYSSSSITTEINITDQSGKVIISRQVTSGEGMNSYVFDDLSFLRAGVYFISVNEPGKISVVKVIKR